MQVAVVLHPPPPGSPGKPAPRCVRPNADGSVDVLRDSKNRIHHDASNFDAVYDETATPRELYADFVIPALSGFMEVCVLCQSWQSYSRNSSQHWLYTMQQAVQADHG